MKKNCIVFKLLYFTQSRGRNIGNELCWPKEEGLLFFFAYSSWYWMWKDCEKATAVCVVISFRSLCSGSAAHSHTVSLMYNHECQICYGPVRRATYPWSQSCCTPIWTQDTLIWSVLRSQMIDELLCASAILSVFCENNDLCVSCGTVGM